jgi:hypothetical protein
MKRLGILLMLACVSGCYGPGSGGERDDGRGEKTSGADFVKRLDKNGDGLVSAEEFDGPAEHFTQFDANKDGFLSADEAPSGPPTGQQERSGRR